jgi:AbrB family looped-hinge helix DNA binding protein
VRNARDAQAVGGVGVRVLRQAAVLRVDVFQGCRSGQWASRAGPSAEPEGPKAATPWLLAALAGKKYYCLAMSKVTSKYQVSIPKALAERVGIRVGDELEWEVEGGVLRVHLAGRLRQRLSIADRLSLFDAAIERQRGREEKLPRDRGTGGRGWTRDELYTR